MGLLLPLGLATTWGFVTQTFSEWYSTRRLPLTTSAFWLMGVAGGLSGLLTIGLLVSWSRGAWLGFGCAALVLLWVLPEKRRHGSLLLLTCLGSGLLLWILGLLPAFLVERVLSFSEDFRGFGDMRGVVISDENFAVVERLAHWQAALNMAATRPWLGVGFGNYEIAYPDFALANWPLALGHAHNYYLNLLAETGIIGLSSYLIFWAVIFHQNWQAIHQAHGLPRAVLAGLLGVWVHLSVHHLVDKLYVNNLFLHIGVMLGLLAVLGESAAYQGQASVAENPDSQTLNKLS
jgi:O-antigen ligase